MELLGSGMSLPAIADTERYVVAGHRSRNAGRRTLLVRAVLLCPALVRICPLLLRRSDTRMQGTGLSTLFESGSVDGGRIDWPGTKHLTQDGALFAGRND